MRCCVLECFRPWWFSCVCNLVFLKFLSDGESVINRTINPAGNDEGVKDYDSGEFIVPFCLCLWQVKCSLHNLFSHYRLTGRGSDSEESNSVIDRTERTLWVKTTACFCHCIGTVLSSVLSRWCPSLLMRSWSSVEILITYSVLLNCYGGRLNNHPGLLHFKAWAHSITAWWDYGKIKR